MDAPADDTEATLAQARRRGDPDALAEALLRQANTLVNRLQVGPARLLLDEAAEIHHSRGRVYEEARLSQLSATLCRLEGRTQEVRARAERAIALAGPGTSIAAGAYAELGELALAAGDAPTAARSFARALAAGESAGMAPAARGALLRKRATALAAAGRPIDAATDLARAHALLLQGGDRAGAERALVERATALHQSGDVPAADRAWLEASQAAIAAGDHQALADLYLLQATGAVERGALDAAIRAVRTAQEQALAAVAPVPYIATALALAELAERAGDRVGAYEALAVGWVTLSDLLGAQAAQAAFEPRLLDQRQRWGDAAFASVKAAYEDRRRAALRP